MELCLWKKTAANYVNVVVCLGKFQFYVEIFTRKKQAGGINNNKQIHQKMCQKHRSIPLRFAAYHHHFNVQTSFSSRTNVAKMHLLLASH